MEWLGGFIVAVALGAAIDAVHKRIDRVTISLREEIATLQARIDHIQTSRRPR